MGAAFPLADLSIFGSTPGSRQTGRVPAST